ncbi:YHYH domain-containing protein [Vibrio galatheae]|uniref:YHYH domain-containing protein n=1 Tax=Vibrio galatheae TaxID=579748 RepID=UPI0009FD97CC|nr:YHYH domain-containing protein [Vibrio galatheae]
MSYHFAATLLFVTFSIGNASAQPPAYLAKVEIAHSGGTDVCGCHHNRKTGEYHCHTRKQRGGSCPP